jgi:uncharacterized protein
LRRRAQRLVPWAWLLALAAAPASAQSSIEADRAEYARWLTTARTSPLAAIAQQPIGPGLQLGPADADVPLEGIGAHRVVARAGGGRLEGASGSRLLPRGVAASLGAFTLLVDGAPGHEVLTVFGRRHAGHPPAYFDVSLAFTFVGPLAPPEWPGTVRVLGVDGIEVEAAEAGSVLVPVGGTRVRLRVRRLPLSGGEESELEIFFRDETNGRGTYPAGRFVPLVPEAGGRYRLDFNRARNPFCAYSSAYPCPAPWAGNAIAVPVTAGERYEAAAR